MTTPSEQASLKVPFPANLFSWLPDGVAIAFGYLLAIVSGIGYWNFHTRNGWNRLVWEQDATSRDIERFLLNGLVFGVIFIGIMHLIAWWAARNGEVANQKVALADLCRLQWPNLIALATLLIFTASPAQRPLTLEFLWSAPLLLTVFLMAWQLFLWFPSYIPRWLSNENNLQQPSPLSLRPYLSIVATITFLFCLYFSVLGGLRYLAVGACVHDFSLYDQLLWNAYEHGLWFHVPVFNDVMLSYDLARFNNNYNAEHFSPGFYIIYPLFWLIPSSVTMIAAHAFLAGLAAIPVFFIALKKLGSPVLGILWAALFLIHPVTQQGTIKDVHVDTFVPLFMLGALAFFLYGRYALMYLSLILAITMKEEITIHVAAFGLFLFFAERARIHGIVISVIGFLSFVLIVGMIIPSFRDGEPLRHIDRFSLIVPDSWGIDANDLTKGDLIKAMLLRPDMTISVLIQESRIRGILLLMAPYALLAFLGRWVWLWILPPLIIALLSQMAIQHEMLQQYGTPHISAITVASIYGMGFLLRVGIPPGLAIPAPRHAAAGLLLLLLSWFSWSERTFFPGGGWFNPEHYTIMERNRIAREFVAAIPPDAVASGQIEIGTLLAPRRVFYMFPTVLDADWIILDTRAIIWPLVLPEYMDYVNELLTNGRWGVVKPYNDGLLLLHRGHATDLNQDALDRLNFTSYREPRFPMEHLHRRPNRMDRFLEEESRWPVDVRPQILEAF